MIPLPLVPAWLTVGTFPFFASVAIHERLGDWTLILGGLVSAAALFGLFFGVKWRAVAGAAQDLVVVVTKSRDEYKAELDSTRQRLGEKLDEASVLIREQADTISELKARPTVELVNAQLREHDAAARKRDEAMIAELGRMTAALAGIAAHCPMLQDPPPAAAARRRRA